MDIQNLIQLFRKQVSDEEKPYLWDDDEVLQFVVAAQDTLVRKVGGISAMTVASGTTELNDLQVVINSPYSTFSPHILRIRSARMLGVARDIKIISEAEFGNICVPDYGIITPVFLSDTDTGVVNYGIIGLVDYKLRWYRVPNTTDTCRLHVYRLPYPRIDDQEDALEIEEQHHYHLIKGMKALAYRKEDAEIYDRNLADSNEAAFEKYCEDARLEKDRQRFKPRATIYGGL